MTRELSLSVVICAYTTARWERLRHAAESVLTGSANPVELIMVIDHCDELLSAARQLFFDGDTRFG